jgi:hypothetical protein
MFKGPTAENVEYLRVAPPSSEFTGAWLWRVVASVITIQTSATQDNAWQLLYSQQLCLC